MPSESGGTRSRSGGMSVSLASPDGRVVGGGVAGLLVAASPVQVRFQFTDLFLFLFNNEVCIEFVWMNCNNNLVSSFMY